MFKSKLPFLFLLALALKTSVSTGQTSKTKPNVVLIYIDDLGYGDLSSYGATQIQTPNIDAVAKDGLLFTNGHCTSATCTPSRYALLTGNYPWRTKGTGILEGDAPLIIPVDKITLPKVFKNEGYTTGIVGKWHLGLGNTVEKDWTGSIKPGPNEVGFDYSFIFPATADRVPTVFMENDRVIGLAPNDSLEVSYKMKIGNEPTGSENPELLKLTSTGTQHSNTIVNGISRIGFMKGGKLARWTDEELGPVFLSKAEQFIEDNKEKPFFLYYAIHDIHTPRMPATMFKGKSKLGYRGDAILEMDWAVGEVVKKLKALGLSENTIIIFSSDNGPVLHDAYNDGAVALNGSHTPAGPYRGGKYQIWEGGTRVPFIVSWPGQIDPGKSNALVTQLDFISSFASFFNQQTPVNEAIDSENLWAEFMGKSKKGRESMIEQGYNDLAVLSGDWKYIPAYEGEKAQLFNLSTDIHEDKNIANRYRKKVKELDLVLQRVKNKK